MTREFVHNLKHKQIKKEVSRTSSIAILTQQVFIALTVESSQQKAVRRDFVCVFFYNYLQISSCIHGISLLSAMKLSKETMSSLLETVFFSFIKQISFSASKINNFRTAVSLQVTHTTKVSSSKLNSKLQLSFS